MSGERGQSAEFVPASGVTDNGGAYLPVCQPCIDGEGSECHTPGCAFWMHDVPPSGADTIFTVAPPDHVALTRALRYAQSVALTERARGRADEERAWLDMCALLEPLTTQPAPITPTDAAGGERGGA